MPKTPLFTLHGPLSAKRSRELQDLQRTGGVLVTTYGMLSSGTGDRAALVRGSASRPWSVVVLDEANKVKNPGTQAAKAVRGVHCEARVLVTGTPVQVSVHRLLHQVAHAQSRVSD